MTNKRYISRVFIISVIYFTVIYLCEFIRGLSPYLHYAIPDHYWLYLMGKCIFCLVIITSALGYGHFVSEKLPSLSSYSPQRIDDYILWILIGTGIIWLALYLLGAIWRYELHLVAIILSLGPAGLLSNKERGFNFDLIKSTNSVTTKIDKLIFIIASSMIIAIFIRFGQVPIDGDFLSHYAQYYIRALHQGSLSPNEVWYHHYYTRGDSIGLAAVAMTDITIKLALSFLFVIISSLMLFQMMKVTTKSKTASAVSLIIFLALLGRANTGLFQKHHAITLYIVTSCFFSIYFIESGRYFKGHFILFISGILAAIISIPTLIFIIASVSFYTITRRRYLGFANSIIMFGVVTISGLVALTTMIINYQTTGLAEITPFRPFIEAANYERLKDWVSPYLLVYLLQGSGEGMGGVALSLNTLSQRVFDIMRWKDISAALSPLLAVPFAISLAYGAYRTRFLAMKSGYLVILSVVFCGFVILSNITVNQPVSVFRATTFVLIPISVLLAIGSTYLTAQLEVITGVQQTILEGFIAVLIGAVALNYSINTKEANFGYKLMTGSANIDEYYSSVMNTYDDTIHKLRRTEVSNARILSLDVINEKYGRDFLLSEGIISEISYSLGPEWHKISFGDANTASNIIQKLGIKYIVINLNHIGIGAIGHSELLSPKEINKYFWVVLRNDEKIVLTPKESMPSKLHREFTAMDDLELSKWASTRMAKKSYIDLYNRVKLIYDYNKENRSSKPDLPNGLTPVKGWQ